jgi:hypothetical protein
MATAKAEPMHTSFVRACVTTSGHYCSTQCEAMKKTPDIDCSC